MQRSALLAVILAGLVVGPMLLAPCRALARADSGMYAVHGIAVDATADNASDAREKAIAQGARKGLEQLMRDLTLPDDAKSLPAVTEKTAGPLVQDFDVESERASATRYIARMGFHFRPDGVKGLLSGAGVRFVASRGPLTLVVPVYRAASGDLLWQPENPWKAAWKDAAAQAALVPVVVPDGTPDDVQALAVADLQNPDKLDALAQRYKAESAVVVIASAVSPTGAPGNGLSLSLVGAGATPDMLQSPGAPTPAAALASGVAATLGELDKLWKQHLLKGTTGPVDFKGGAAPLPETADPGLAGPQGNQFAIRAAITGPGDWSALRTKLSQAQGIHRVQLKSLTREDAVIVVTVAGDDDDLAQVLAKAGLIVGPAEAVPASEAGDLATMVPTSGPGAGLIYPLTATGQQ